MLATALYCMEGIKARCIAYAYGFGTCQRYKLTQSMSRTQGRERAGKTENTASFSSLYMALNDIIRPWAQFSLSYEMRTREVVVSTSAYICAGSDAIHQVQADSS